MCPSIRHRKAITRPERGVVSQRLFRSASGLLVQVCFGDESGRPFDVENGILVSPVSYIKVLDGCCRRLKRYAS